MKLKNLKNFFDAIIKEETGGYASLREYLEDTLDYGQTAFVYYSETTGLYGNFREECEAWLESLASERGLNPWNVFPDWEIFPDSEKNKWLVITAMFEEHCRDMLEGLENVQSGF